MKKIKLLMLYIALFIIGFIIGNFLGCASSDVKIKANGYSVEEPEYETRMYIYVEKRF